jgi:hypothetical protein
MSFPKDLKIKVANIILELFILEVVHDFNVKVRGGFRYFRPLSLLKLWASSPDLLTLRNV